METSTHKDLNHRVWIYSFYNIMALYHVTSDHGNNMSFHKNRQEGRMTQMLERISREITGINWFQKRQIVSELVSSRDRGKEKQKIDSAIWHVTFKGEKKKHLPSLSHFLSCNSDINKLLFKFLPTITCFKLYKRLWAGLSHRLSCSLSFPYILAHTKECAAGMHCKGKAFPKAMLLKT